MKQHIQSYLDLVSFTLSYRPEEFVETRNIAYGTMQADGVGSDGVRGETGEGGIKENGDTYNNRTTAGGVV